MADSSSVATSASAGVIAGTGNTIDSALNVSSPYYLHPSENPGLVLVTSVLTGSNYHTWSRAMKVALQSKNKLGFVDGTISMLTISDSNYSTWLRCNTMVCTWITRSLSPTIAQSILWLDKAYDIWNDLKARFAVSDLFRVTELQDEIYAFRQGDLSISEYYTKLKIFWDEYMILCPITRCSCNFICPCATYLDNDYTLWFLKGLNDRFAPVKSQIMLLEPLPSVHKVFSLLLQQEREMISPPGATEPVILFNKGPQRHPSNASSSGFNSRSSGSVGSNSTKFCTYCNRPRHTIDTCYRKHGFPPGFKFRGQGSNAPQMKDPVVNSVIEHPPSSTGPFASSDPKSASIPQFTQDQYQKLLALVQMHPTPSTSPMSSVNNLHSVSSSHQDPGSFSLEDDWYS
ncbi:hypothetical protein QN277_022931 [Acacia crassicarpa]|uniref:Retrotransposon Copia-like N-terminal domain-containing protein n=1 Tax=Acacia crassicarpa TaxID=499986 RepID=A0AAE1JK33_9FABA|nr:hypothetical protein QN277_022931 [Acacia crassicarpa]